MTFVLRWIARAILLLAVLMVLLLAPVGYVELACQGPVPSLLQVGFP